MEATIALAGNPNSGKTTLFNALTGARRHVGNYPGVTVEKKQGAVVNKGYKFSLVDLPGTYSLTAYSLEEVVARDFLVNENPELVINIVDASNLERNLYLAVQFMEMGVPICIALNMIDVAEKRGVRIDAVKLSELLGVPVTPTVARSGKGKQALMDSAADLIRSGTPMRPLSISYGRDIDGVLDTITRQIEEHEFLTNVYPPRWVALKYIENDEQIHYLGRKSNPALDGEFKHLVRRLGDHLQMTEDSYPEAVIADHRYGFIRSILKQGIVSYQNEVSRHFFVSDKIDKIVTQRFIGPLIMAAVIWTWLGGLAETHLADGLLKSLLIDGIIEGVGGVLGFAPLIMFMFFGIALLEDSGYLARVAYMLDRVFRLKFRQDQLNEGSEVCPGCGCTRNCTPGRIDANCKNIV